MKNLIKRKGIEVINKFSLLTLYFFKGEVNERSYKS